jgi:glycosyltransferase involved in cell wall biosynthesis
LRLYPEFDLVIFPSLHDTGGYTVLEAMANGLPVLCLDCGGPAMAVGEGRGLKVPLGPRSGVIESLAAGLRRYDRERSLLAAHGEAARQFVRQTYAWDTKGLRMSEVYRDTVRRSAAARRPASGRQA